MPFIKNVQYKLSPEQLEKLDAESKSIFFPNIVSDGFFVPHSTIVRVSSFNTEAVKNALEKGNLSPVKDCIKILCHEMTHWFDFFGTVWGREYIEKICRAYCALETRNPLHYPDIIALFDEDRKVLSPQYYTYSKPPSATHDLKRPWLINFTMGVEFDSNGNICEDKPVFMVHYGENPSTEDFARQPLWVGTLLEVRSVASEIKSAITAICTHPDKDTHNPEIILAMDGYSKMAYNHELIEYNTAAHLFSRISEIKDIIQSYLLAAELAYIALNMSEEDFKNLKVPKEFKRFGDRNEASKMRQDRGYAYACMVFNGGKFTGDESKYIEHCLSASNLGTQAEIIGRAKDLLKQSIEIPFMNGPIAHFVHKLLISENIIDIHQALDHRLITLEALLTDLMPYCPPFMDQDTDFVTLSKDRPEEYHPGKMIEAANDLKKHTENILSACRGPIEIILR